MAETSPFFAAELGIEHGRVDPTTFETVEGSHLFVLGAQTAGWTQDFDFGEYVQVEQLSSVLGTDRLLRFRAKIRGPGTMPLIAQDETYALADGQTSIFSVDGGANQSVLFSTADFGDIANARASEVVGIINRTILGARAYLVGDGFAIKSSSTGRRSGVLVAGGSAGIGYSEAVWQASLLINGTVVFSARINAGDERDLSDFGASLASFGLTPTFTFRLEVLGL